jgi:hypothetical protein
MSSHSRSGSPPWMSSPSRSGSPAPKIQQLPLLLTDLPPELVAQVLGLLDDRSLALVVPACRCFRDSLMPSLWVSRLQQRFPHSSWDSCGAPCTTLACLSLLHKTAWAGARAQGAPPADRGGHSCVALRGGRWQIVFGGANGDALFSDAYVLLTPAATADGSFRWQPLRLDGGPSARWAHTCVSYLDSMAVIVGGHSGPHGALGDVAALGVVGSVGDVVCHSSLHWLDAAHLRTTGAPPSPRYGHAACCRGDSLWLLGGIVGGPFDAQAAADLHEARLSHAGTRGDLSGDLALEMHWSERRPAGPPPAACFGHSLVEAADALWIFGGRPQPYYTPLTLEASPALHTLRGLGAGGALRWEVLQAEGPPPSPRAFHACMAVGNSLLVMGGESGLPSEVDEIVYLSDVHTLRCGPQGARWQQLQPEAPDGTALAPASSLAAICLIDAHVRRSVPVG